MSRYQPGFQGRFETIFANGALGINNEILHSTICPAVRNSLVDQVFLAGNSRGAIMALGLAVDIMEKNKCGRRPEKLWLGMVDAVNLSMPNWPTKVPKGVSAIHIVKQRMDPLVSNQLNWTTAEIADARKIVAADPDLTHADIGWDEGVLNGLLKSASAAGGSFKR